MSAAALPEAPAAAPAAGMRKRLLIVGVLAVVAVAAVGFGIHWWRVGRFVEDTDDAYVGGEVTVIGAKVGGYIAQVAATDNQAVHAGDLLVKLDDRDYRAALQKAEGAVAAQQALLANLDASERLQQAVIGQAQAGVGAAEAERIRARDDQARYRDLSRRAAVSVESAQRAEATYRSAEAGSQKSRAALVAAQRELAVIATRRQEAEAALAQARAGQELARLDLGYTELRAPADGTVGNRAARAGAYAAPGSQLLSLVPARGLWVDANFKEDQLARMRPGQPVAIRADVLPGRVFHGRVASLAPATGAQFSVLPPENATGNFTKIVQRVPVRVRLEQGDDRLGLLRPGLSVTAEVDTRGADVP